MMNRNTIITKILEGQYDTRTNAFIQSYDDIFRWVIARDHSNTLSVNIYSFDFLMIWDENAQTFEHTLSNNRFIVHINNHTLPRYGFTIAYWLKDLHKCSNLLSDYLIKDINHLILSYIL